MLTQGPIPAALHGLIEYLAAALCIAAPFLFSFESDAATGASIAIGVLILVVAASTSTPTGLVKLIPIPAHLVLDFALAALLIAAPFLFGFSEDEAATPFFLVLGVLHLLVTIATRFTKPGTKGAEHRPRRS